MIISRSFVGSRGAIALEWIPPCRWCAKQVGAGEPPFLELAAFSRRSRGRFTANQQVDPIWWR
jgi:hypothetical protein